MALALAACGMLAACSIDGALMQPGDVSSVGSITPPAPVGSAGPAYRETANAQMPPQETPSSWPSSEDSADGTATAFPAAASTDSSVYAMPAPASQGQPAALAAPAPGTTGSGEGAGPSGRQPGVVSVMDTDRVVEGDTRDPVVSGVGTSHPVAVSGGGSTVRTIRAPDGSETEIYTGPPGRGAPPRPLSLPPGASEADAGRATDPADGAFEVAALPRPVNPMSQASDALDEPVAPAPAPEPTPHAAAPAPQSTWEENSGGSMPVSEVACRRELKRLGVTYTDIPRISHGPACGIDWPIKVTALSGGIRIKPAATLNCQVTAEFAKWVKSDLAPAARMRYFSGISSITQLSSYSCRTMNSQRGAPMSEHAHGNAIDIGAITLNSGRQIDVRKPGLFAFRQRGFLNTVRAESCDNFTTVLGPGTNKYHWNHFHFDLRHRKSGRSYCE